VTDVDLVFHRFEIIRDGLGCRKIDQLMMVELKTEDERITPPQKDTLGVLNGLLSQMIPVDGTPIGVEARPSFILNRDRKVIWRGIHLLRVPGEQSDDGPFYWDHHEISRPMLIQILNFEVLPWRPHRKIDDLRRHKNSECAEQLKWLPEP
jgi:hypothetical protein